jgi:hypothetical protein
MEKVLVGLVLLVFLIGIAGATFTAQVSANAGNVNLYQTSSSESTTGNRLLFNNSSQIHNVITGSSAILTLGRTAMQKATANSDGITGSTLLQTTGSVNAFDAVHLDNEEISGNELCADIIMPTINGEMLVISQKDATGITGVVGSGNGDDVLTYSSNTMVSGTSASVGASATLPHDTDLLYGRMVTNKITNLSQESNLFTVMIQGDASAYANNSSTGTILLNDD